MKIEKLQTIRVHIHEEFYCDVTPSATPKYYDFRLYRNGYGLSTYMFTVQTTPDDIPVLVNRNAPDYMMDLLDAIDGEITSAKYFCNECGNRFIADIPYKNKHGLNNAPCCPVCGCYCTFPDTEKGSADSVQMEINYENEQRNLYDEE